MFEFYLKITNVFKGNFYIYLVCTRVLTGIISTHIAALLNVCCYDWLGTMDGEG